MTRSPSGRGGAAVAALLAALAAAGPVAAETPARAFSVLDERPAAQAPARSDPVLRARFLEAYLAARGLAEQRRVLDAYLPSLGVGGLLDALESKFVACHGRAHEVGKAAYAHFQDMPKVLLECQARCTDGCMHGVLMEVFTESPRGLRARVATLCDEAPMRDVYKKGDCAHGVGHGVAYIANYDMAEALLLCSEIRGQAFQYYCASGAFMQLFMAKGDEIEARHDHAPCDTAPRFAAACYRYNVFFLRNRLAREGKGLRDLLAECLGLPPKIQPACFHGIGHAHVGPISVAPAHIHAVCEHGPAAAQWLCIQGVVEKLAEADPAAAAQVCAELAGKNAEVCREAAANKLYSPTKIGLEHYFAGP